MSASREKKQRQGAGPDQKSVKVQQEQAARKRQTIIYTVTGVIIAALVIALLVWRSGFFQARSAAATVGDETLTTAELSYYYYAARQTTAMYANYGMSTFDTSKPDDQQLYNETEGQTYRDYFMESALNTAQQHLALSKEAVNAGHSESEVKSLLDAEVSEVKSDASAAGYSYSAYLKAIYGNYMTPGVYEKLYSRYLLASLVATDKHDELYGGYTQSDLDAYYQEHADELDTIEYSYLYFPIPTVDSKDEDGNERTEDEVNKLKKEAADEAKQNAEDALEAVQSGSSFDSQKTKYDLTTGADHTTQVGTSYLNSNYRDQLLALNDDACTLVETENGYYVISLHSRHLDETPTRDTRHILVQAENTTEEHEGHTHLVAPTDEAWAAAKAKMDEVQSAWESSGKTEEDFARLANENSDDSDGSDGGLYERVSPGSFVSEYDEWLFDSARKAGDVELIQHAAEEESTSGYYGYHLVYYIGENEPVWMGTAREALTSAAQQEWSDSLTANYPTAQLSGADYFGK